MLEDIIENYPDETFLVMEGHDNAIIGVDMNTMRLVYSVTAILENLMAQGMDDEEAIEFYEYNIASAYFGEKTPVLCEDTFDSKDHLNN